MKFIYSSLLLFVVANGSLALAAEGLHGATGRKRFIENDNHWQGILLLSKCYKDLGVSGGDGAQGEMRKCVREAQSKFGSAHHHKWVANYGATPTVIEAAMALVISGPGDEGLGILLSLPPEKFTPSVREALLTVLNRSFRSNEKILIMCRFVKGTACSQNPSGEISTLIKSGRDLAPEAKSSSFRKVMRRLAACKERIDDNPGLAIAGSMLGLQDCVIGERIYSYLEKLDRR